MRPISDEDLHRHYANTYVQVRNDKTSELLPEVFWADGTVQIYEGAGRGFRVIDSKENIVYFSAEEYSLVNPSEDALVEHDGNVFLICRNGHRQWRIGFCEGNSSVTHLLGNMVEHGLSFLRRNSEIYTQTKHYYDYDRRGMFRDINVAKQVFGCVKFNRTIVEGIAKLLEGNMAVVLKDFIWLSLAPEGNDIYFMHIRQDIAAKIKGKEIVTEPLYKQEVLDYLKRSHQTHFNVS